MKRIKKIETTFQYLGDNFFAEQRPSTIRYETSDGRSFDSFEEAKRYEICKDVSDKYHTLLDDFSIETGHGTCIFYIKSKEEHKAIMDYWVQEGYAYMGSHERKEFLYPTYVELEVSHADMTFHLYPAESIDHAMKVVNWMWKHGNIKI